MGVICFYNLGGINSMTLRRSLKINKYYQYISLVVGVGCIVFSALESVIYMALLGGYIAINAIGTLKHIHTGEHDKDSTLPKDIKIK
jgi:hypothetical protein